MSKKTQIRMSYNTYVYLRNHLELMEKKIHGDYIIAIEHIKSLEPWKLREKANDAAWEHFNTGVKQLIEMKDELFVAAQSTYKDHPRKEMREFWLLKK
jgi:hypothetical protein